MGGFVPLLRRFRSLGTHLLLGDDWQAMFQNSVRNLEEERTRLFNAVLERKGD